VRVEVHQGPLLFIIVMKTLLNSFKQGLPSELLYADNSYHLYQRCWEVVGKFLDVNVSIYRCPQCVGGGMWGQLVPRALVFLCWTLRKI